MEIDELKNNDRVKKKSPSFAHLMLAKLKHEPSFEKNLIYERKLDGERCLAVRNGKKVTLYSRNHNEINASYPEIVEKLEKQKETQFVLDGEIVAFKGSTTSFSKLQKRMNLKDKKKVKESSVAVYYYVFDLINLSGYDISELDLVSRKKLLKKYFSFKDRHIRFTAHRSRNGEKFYEEACENKWEGLIAKEKDSKYLHTRSSKWMKYKCVNEQEFVIGGYTDPQGERSDFGALLIGYYDDDTLKFAGKVGTGFDEDLLETLGKKLRSRKRKTTPFEESDDLPDGDSIHWVTPELVGQVGFTEWTDDGKLRHPRFKGLRRDKDAKDVVREG